MGAIILLREKNLAAEVPTVKATSLGASTPLIFKVEDTPGFDNDAPLVIPSGASIQRSYEVWLRLAFGVVGPATNLTSPVFYTDGSSSFGPGVTLYARTTNAGSYSTPSIPANDSAGTNAFF